MGYQQMIRDTSVSTPEPEMMFGSREDLLSTLSHFKIGIFNKGSLIHELAPGRLTSNKYGQTVAIDGTNGDVMVYTDTNIYFDRFVGYIDAYYGDSYKRRTLLSLGTTRPNNSDTYKCFAPFAFTPHYTVTAKIGNDWRIQPHCCYNPNIVGDNNFAIPDVFEQKIKNGGYLDFHYLPNGPAIQARKKNEDPNNKGNYIGLYHDHLAIWYAAMYLEMGTMDVFTPDRMGMGCINKNNNPDSYYKIEQNYFDDEGISGVSGCLLVKEKGEFEFINLTYMVRRGGAYPIIAGIGGCSGLYCGTFTECLEAQRVLDKIKANGLVSYIGDSSVVFTDGGATVITNGSVHLFGGHGMEYGKKYYKVRNVPNCQGLGEGVMTAVVNIYVKLRSKEIRGECNMKDLTGDYIFKFSHSVYRGVDLHSGFPIPVEGVYFVKRGSFSEEDPEGRNYSWWATPSEEDVPVITLNTEYFTDDTNVEDVKEVRLPNLLNTYWNLRDHDDNYFEHLFVGDDYFNVGDDYEVMAEYNISLFAPYKNSVSAGIGAVGHTSYREGECMYATFDNIQTKTFVCEVGNLLIGSYLGGVNCSRQTHVTFENIPVVGAFSLINIKNL